MLEDVFDLQDRVTASVVGAIAPKLEQAEIERARQKPTESLDAYDYYLRGMAALHRWTPEANAEALTNFSRAIELDPDFASAYGNAARCYVQRKAGGWVNNRAKEIDEAGKLARRAAELGKGDAVALCTAGIGLAFVAGELDDGAALIDRALVLNPNLAWAWMMSGWVKVWRGGEAEAAIEHAQRAMRLSPQDSQIFAMQAGVALAHFFAGRLDEALSWAETAMREQPNFSIAICVAAAAAALGGRPAEAEKAMARLRRLNPALRLSNLRELMPIRQLEDLAKMTDGLRRAGLPE
jgi:tetratricopeptide (TPR) repeat protein